MEIKVEDKELELMRTLLGGRKYLDMGRTPVSLIQLAWEWEDAGLIVTDGEGYISLTEDGKKLFQ